MDELAQYDYELPRDLIAQQPLANRTDARLMLLDRTNQSIEHHHVRDLPDLLSSGDCLVFNDSRVIPARLVGYRTSTRGRWEGLFLEADQHLWKILSKTRGKLAAGDTVTLVDREARDDIELTLVERLGEGQWLARPGGDAEALEVLERVGRVPLPHYIRGGEMLPDDRHRYQTVFSRHPGSIAAPTAGLHFTETLLQRLDSRGVQRASVTLHVGMGTFRPISAPVLDDHTMHSEWGTIDATTAAQINGCRDAGGRIVAVGTTSVRLLESAAAGEHLQAWTGRTELFIRPPYRFRAIDGLLTNFHLPRSTLLVLVRCFGGDPLVRRAYQEAIAQKYRFYSYGDAMLIL